MQCPECWEAWVWMGGPPPGWLADDDPFRKFCKALVYRLLYGGQVKTAHTIPGAMTLGLLQKELHEASQALIDKHPGMGKYWEIVHEQALRDSLVRDFMGRARFLMGIDDEEKKRAASNHPIQGGAAEFLNTTVVSTEVAAPWSTLTYTCHDYLGRTAHVDKLDELDRIMQYEAELPREITTVYGNVVNVSVPFAMDDRKLGSDYTW